MSEQKQVIIHAIAEDGLPDMDSMTGRVAFIFNGCIVSGWPLRSKEDGFTLWEGDSDVARRVDFGGVTHWIEFPEPLWDFVK